MRGGTRVMVKSLITQTLAGHSEPFGSYSECAGKLRERTTASDFHLKLAPCCYRQKLKGAILTRGEQLGGYCIHPSQ